MEGVGTRVYGVKSLSDVAHRLSHVDVYVSSNDRQVEISFARKVQTTQILEKHTVT